MLHNLTAQSISLPISCCMTTAVVNSSLIFQSVAMAELLFLQAVLLAVSFIPQLEVKDI